MIEKLLIGGFLFTLLPIWRGAGHSRHDGVNLWRLIYDSTYGIREEGSVFGHTHILYSEAVRRAQTAYGQLH